LESEEIQETLDWSTISCVKREVCIAFVRGGRQVADSPRLGAIRVPPALDLAAGRVVRAFSLGGSP